MYTYQARVTRVVDGDTFEADVDLGFYMTCRMRFRLLGYNAPELTGKEKAHGELARTVLMSMLLGPWAVTIRTERGDSFGRWLASVELVDHSDAVSALIGGGWGVAWDGRGKRPEFDPNAEYPLR